MKTTSARPRLQQADAFGRSMPSHEAHGRSESHRRLPGTRTADPEPPSRPHRCHTAGAIRARAALAERRHAASCSLLPTQNAAWICRFEWTRVGYLRDKHTTRIAHAEVAPEERPYVWAKQLEEARSERSVDGARTEGRLGRQDRACDARGARGTQLHGVLSSTNAVLVNTN